MTGVRQTILASRRSTIGIADLTRQGKSSKMPVRSMLVRVCLESVKGPFMRPSCRDSAGIVEIGLTHYEWCLRDGRTDYEYQAFFST